MYSVLSRTLDRKPSLEFGFEEEKFKSSGSIEFFTSRRRTEIFRNWGQNLRVILRGFLKKEIVLPRI